MNNTLSLTKDLRNYLTQTNSDTHSPNTRDYILPLESIRSIATKMCKTLETWVYDDPQTAVFIAQSIVANYDELLHSIAIGSVEVAKDSVKLIDKASDNARTDLAYVQAIIDCGDSTEARKDRLIQAIYNRALKGDTRAATYIFDRIDGKIAENSVQTLDYSSADNVFKIVHSLFMKQLDVVNSGPGSKIICGSRKMGKTRLLAALALIDALRTTNTVVLIIGQTMQLEENLINIEVNKMIEELGLTSADGKRLNWRHLDNGSKIMVRGLSNTKDPDTIRGLNAQIILMDEFFHMNSELLSYMQTEVLDPMQLAYGDSYKFVMVGTPPPIKGTYGEKVWNESNIQKFFWTGKDNPHIKDFDKFVDEKCEEHGVDRGTPFIRREYLGEWAYDEDALLYPKFFTWTEETVPRFDVDRILIGVDYGASDNDAVVATAWDTRGRRGFVFYEEKFNRLTCPKSMTQWEFLKACCKEVWEYALDFWPGIDKKEANKRIIWAADSSDGQLTEELRVNLKCRYQELSMGIGVAHKHDKILMQDKIRDLFRTAKLLVPYGGRTSHELEMTVLKRDMRGNLQLEVDDKIYHPDLLPALRYALWEVLGMEVINTRTGNSVDQSYQLADHIVGGMNV